MNPLITNFCLLIWMNHNVFITLYAQYSGSIRSDKKKKTKGKEKCSGRDIRDDFDTLALVLGAPRPVIFLTQSLSLSEN